MGGDGRGDPASSAGDVAPDEAAGSHASSLASAFHGHPGGVLAEAIEQHSRSAGPLRQVPIGSSTDPLAEVVHVVAAARRLESWSIWAQLNMIARLIAAWEAAPPVSNDIEQDDRCETRDPALAERLNGEISRFQRSVRGEWSGDADALAPVFATSEVSLACGLTRYSADRRVTVAQALFLEGRLPRVRRLLQAGWVDWAKLDAFVHDTLHLDVMVANAVERLVLGELPGEQPECPDAVDVVADTADPGADLPVFVRLTTPQVRAAIAGAINALDAEAAARRAEKARERRGVSCRADLDGMATLTADLAVEATAAVWNVLTDAAKKTKAAGDPRTMDQLRADELVARVTRIEAVRADPEAAGLGQLRCVPPIPWAVSLTIPLATYLGLVDDPAQLDGYGPIPAGLARRLATDAAREHRLTTTWRCVIVDDEHGAVLGVSRPISSPRHDPPARLADVTTTSEPTCCFPGCRIQARRCDLDHRIPYDRGGPTCSCNLEPLCRGHHQWKTRGLINIRALGPDDDPDAPPGTLEFTTRTGLRYRRMPTRLTARAANVDDAEVAAAITHARAVDAQRAAGEARVESQPGYREWARRDDADAIWHRSYTALQSARAATEARRAARRILDAELERILPPLRVPGSAPRRAGPPPGQ